MSFGQSLFTQNTSCKNKKRADYVEAKQLRRLSWINLNGVSPVEFVIQSQFASLMVLRNYFGDAEEFQKTVSRCYNKCKHFKRIDFNPTREQNQNFSSSAGERCIDLY
jgi:hypothetical protein